MRLVEARAGLPAVDRLDGLGLAGIAATSLVGDRPAPVAQPQRELAAAAHHRQQLGLSLDARIAHGYAIARLDVEGAAACAACRRRWASTVPPASS